MKKLLALLPIISITIAQAQQYRETTLYGSNVYVLGELILSDSSTPVSQRIPTNTVLQVQGVNVLPQQNLTFGQSITFTNDITFNKTITADSITGRVINTYQVYPIVPSLGIELESDVFVLSNLTVNGSLDVANVVGVTNIAFVDDDILMGSESLQTFIPVNIYNPFVNEDVFLTLTGNAKFDKSLNVSENLGVSNNITVGGALHFTPVSDVQGYTNALAVDSHSIHWFDSDGEKHELDGNYGLAAYAPTIQTQAVTTSYTRLNLVFSNYYTGEFEIRNTTNTTYIGSDPHVFKINYYQETVSPANSYLLETAIYKNGILESPSVMRQTLKTAPDTYNCSQGFFITLYSNDIVEIRVKGSSANDVVFNSFNTDLFRIK